MNEEEGKTISDVFGAGATLSQQEQGGERVQGSGKKHLQ